MRRLRLVFLAVGLALLVPVTLLIARAVESVALERELRHRTVAERLFDEMERALSAVLEREEGRAVERYDRPIIASDSPFVVGHFEIDADGGARVVEGSREAAAALLARVGSAFRAGTAAAPRPASAAPKESAPAMQVPGTTVEVGGLEPRAAGQQEADEVSAFNALRSLNKAVAQRADRQRKREDSSDYVRIEGTLGRAESVPSAAPRGADVVDFRADALGAQAAAPRDDASESERATASALADAAPRMNEAVRRDDQAAGAPLEPEPPSMDGRLVDADNLLLYRTVAGDRRHFRQGLVLDVAQLGRWLGTEAVGDAGLASFVTLDFTTPLSPPLPPIETDLAYTHRFAEPFAALGARLVLKPLPSVVGTRYVHALSTLLLVTLVLGLAALYRMVSVAVSFAERRSNFVAAVSHELKTPLTAIRMYGEMLRDGIVPSEEKRAEYYRHITVESERLSRLINNVLEFSRLEKGTRQMVLVSGPLAPVVDEAATLLRPHVEGERFTLELEVAPDLPSVRFERDALLQVIFNLVDNAVKYARDGAIKRITLTCRRDGDGVQLAVRDHGQGVPGDHLRRIFEPFYRGETELTRRSKGTGLGLALVRGLAQRMGARIDGRNVPGGGFEVVIIFAPAP